MKFGEMSLTFELSTLKLGTRLYTNAHENLGGKKIDLIFK